MTCPYPLAQVSGCRRQQERRKEWNESWRTRNEGDAWRGTRAGYVSATVSIFYPLLGIDPPTWVHRFDTGVNRPIVAPKAHP